jgi:hypothetical protein
MDLDTIGKKLDSDKYKTKVSTYAHRNRVCVSGKERKLKIVKRRA